MVKQSWWTNSVPVAAAVAMGGLLSAGWAAQERQPASDIAPKPAPLCSVDLGRPGTMRDILSNALLRGLKLPQRDVVLFLDGAGTRCAGGQELLTATAAHFKIAEGLLAAKVEKFKHCNCTHAVESALHSHLRVDPAPHPGCEANLELAGVMADIVANALVRGLRLPETSVELFLDGAREKYADGPELFEATAVHFKLSEDALAAKVREFRHCNCNDAQSSGGAAPGSLTDLDLPVTSFARDTTLHVVLHELGHAVIREFDIPVLGNEETMADAFATYYLTTYLPDRALDVLTARVTSLMIEATEDAGVDWSGEHDHDARRANQIAALAVAADAVKYKPVADVVGMSQQDIRKAVDYGAEIRRSWRRVLAPLWMPEGAASAEARVTCDEGSAFVIRLCEGGLAGEVEAALRRFDWHSQVTIRFIEGDGRAGWNRSARTVTVHSAYVRRFIQQGQRGLAPAAK